MITARADVQNDTQLLCPACEADLHLQAWRDPASYADAGVQMHRVACVEGEGTWLHGPTEVRAREPLLRI
jgi:hypothetical protein